MGRAASIQVASASGVGGIEQEFACVQGCATEIPCKLPGPSLPSGSVAEFAPQDLAGRKKRECFVGMEMVSLQNTGFFLSFDQKRHACCRLVVFEGRCTLFQNSDSLFIRSLH